MDTNEASGLSKEITSGLVAEVAVFTVICLFIVVLSSCNNVAGFCHVWHDDAKKRNTNAKRKDKICWTVRPCPTIVCRIVMPFPTPRTYFSYSSCISCSQSITFSCRVSSLSPCQHRTSLWYRRYCLYLLLVTFFLVYKPVRLFVARYWILTLISLIAFELELNQLYRVSRSVTCYF